MKYKFTMKHVPGKINTAADALSRHPVRSPSPHEEEVSRHCSLYIEATLQASLSMSGINPEVMSLSRISEVAGGDKTSRELCECIVEGFPDVRAELSPNVQPYWALREDFSVFNNIPIYKNVL